MGKYRTFRGRLIRQENVRYADTARKKNIPQEFLKDQLEDINEKEETIETDNFTINIKRKGNVILAMQIMHSSSDSISVDFSYT